MLTSGVISKPCLPCTVCVDRPITITLAPSSRKRITGTQNSRSSTSCATKIPTVFPCRRIIYIAPFQVHVHETLYHVLKRKSPIPFVGIGLFRLRTHYCSIGGSSCGYSACGCSS